MRTREDIIRENLKPVARLFDGTYILGVVIALGKQKLTVVSSPFYDEHLDKALNSDRKEDLPRVQCKEGGAHNTYIINPTFSCKGNNSLFTTCVSALGASFINNQYIFYKDFKSNDNSMLSILDNLTEKESSRRLPKTLEHRLLGGTLIIDTVFDNFLKKEVGYVTSDLDSFTRGVYLLDNTIVSYLKGLGYALKISQLSHKVEPISILNSSDDSKGYLTREYKIISDSEQRFPRLKASQDSESISSCISSVYEMLKLKAPIKNMSTNQKDLTNVIFQTTTSKIKARLDLEDRDKIIEKLENGDVTLLVDDRQNSIRGVIINNMPCLVHNSVRAGNGATTVVKQIFTIPLQIATSLGLRDYRSLPKITFITPRIVAIKQPSSPIVAVYGELTDDLSYIVHMDIDGNTVLNKATATLLNLPTVDFQTENLKQSDIKILADSGNPYFKNHRDDRANLKRPISEEVIKRGKLDLLKERLTRGIDLVLIADSLTQEPLVIVVQDFDGQFLELPLNIALSLGYTHGTTTSLELVKAYSHKLVNTRYGNIVMTGYGNHFDSDGFKYRVLRKENGDIIGLLGADKTYTPTPDYALPSNFDLELWHTSFLGGDTKFNCIPWIEELDSLNNSKKKSGISGMFGNLRDAFKN